MQTYINLKKKLSLDIRLYEASLSCLHLSKNSTLNKTPPLTADGVYEWPLINIISRLRIKLMPFAWLLNF